MKNKKEKKAQAEMTYPSSLQIRFIFKFVFMILEQIIAHVTIRRRLLCWTQQLQGSVWEARSAAVSCCSTAAWLLQNGVRSACSAIHSSLQRALVGLRWHPGFLWENWSSSMQSGSLAGVATQNITKQAFSKCTGSGVQGRFVGWNS